MQFGKLSPLSDASRGTWETIANDLTYLSDEISGVDRQQISEVLTPGQLHDFVRNYIGIYIPDKAVCTHHVSPFEALCDAFFARYVVTVWKASRGFGGKTLMLAILSFSEIVLLGAAVNLLGGSTEQSRRSHDYMTGRDTNLPNTFWGYPTAPRHLIIGKSTMGMTRLTNGGQIKVLPASQTSVRGPHPQRLRIDEADEADIDIIDSALGQPMDARGITAQTVISSTHQYANGTMTEILKRADEKPEWRSVEWCYRENMTEKGWLSLPQVNAKKATVTKSMWDTEYENQEPNPANRAIVPEAVEKMFSRDLGVYEGEIGCKLIFEEPRMYCRSRDHSRYEIPFNPEITHCPYCRKSLYRIPYAAGADWAKQNDQTVLEIYRTDETPMRMVGFFRMNRLPWPVMVGEWNALLQKYDPAGAHDNTGLGDVIDDYLTWYAEPITMVGKVRSDMLSNYIAAVERGELIAPFIQSMYNEHKRASVADVYEGGKKNHLPDTISSGSLMYLAFEGSAGIG